MKTLARLLCLLLLLQPSLASATQTYSDLPNTTPPGLTGLDMVNGINANTDTLLTNSAGTSAPSSPVAYQTWIDTTNKLIKFYDGTNWNVIGAYDGSGNYSIQPAALPHATTGAFGAVKCDGTTITCTGGVIASVGSGMVYPGAGIPVSTGSGWSTSITAGTGVATALAVNVGSSGAFVTNGGALGTPSGGVATNLTGTASGLSVGGNAATATALQTARTIGGTSFNGTSNITVATATGGFTISGGNLTLSTENLVTDTTTGTEIATGSTQKLGFFGATPIVRPSGDIITLLQNLGLGSSITIASGDLPSGTASTSTQQTWTASQAVTPSSLTISTATFTPTFGTSNNFNLTLVHASCPCTLANPSGTINPGQSGQIVVNQSSTGSDTITTYGSDYIFINGTKPTLSTAANSKDILSYYAIDSTHLAVSYGIGFQ